MKPDDESYLSAYFDDELPPDERREVEARLAADPGPARELADMGTVRSLVAALPRPGAPCRLASAVLSGVARDRSARSRRPVYWVATAASVVFACLLTYRSGLVARPAPPLVADRPTPQEISAGPTVPESVAVADRGEATTPRDDPKPAVVEPSTPANDPDAGARRRLVAMLDAPGLGRVLIPGERGVADRVEGLLRESARKDPDYVRMAVPAGLALDPAHPEGGEILVAVMDDLERREFLGRLGLAAVLESSADPKLGPALADVRGLTLGSGPSAAGLKPPPPEARVALQHPEAKNHATESVQPIPGGFRGDLMERSTVVVQPEDPGDDEPVGPPALPGPRKVRGRPAGPVPVILWVLPSGAEGERR